MDEENAAPEGDKPKAPPEPVEFPTLTIDPRLFKTALTIALVVGLLLFALMYAVGTHTVTEQQGPPIPVEKQDVSLPNKRPVVEADQIAAPSPRATPSAPPPPQAAPSSMPKLPAGHKIS